MEHTNNPITRDRQLAGAAGAAIVFDAAVVHAPFLVIAAVPFLVAAWRYRGRHTAATLALAVWCALWVLVGVTYALSNGLHAPTEPNQATETIGIGDVIGVFVGAPLAAWLGVRLVVGRVRHRVAA